jgi:predicted Zn-dependent peptidase
MLPTLCAAALLLGTGGPVERFVLDNGLTVLLAEDHRAPLVSVGVMYSVGARNEAAGITGLAHYAEHMNFRATARFPGTEITEAITRIGGRWNGYTWIDQTWYVETVPRDAFEKMLDLERDRMASALYDPEDFRQERTSVIAELHSYDDPHSVLYDAVLAASYEIHPYRNNTIGYLSDVEAVTRDQAFAFYRRYYHPNNAVLAVVGDFDPAAARQAIRARFGALPASGESTAVVTTEPPQTGQRRVTVNRPGPHAEAIVAFRAPALTDPDFAAMVVFDALFAGGKGLRFTADYPAPRGTPLARALVDSGAATRAATDWQASRYPYVYTVTAAVPAGPGAPAALARAEQAIFAALDEAGGRAWTDSEVAAAFRQLASAYAADLDDLPGRAHQLAFFEVSGGYQHLLDLPARAAAVTAQDLRRFVRERLAPERATVGWFVPSAPAAQPSPPPPTGSPLGRWPAPAAPPAAATAAPTTAVLANGATLIVAPAPGPLAALKGRFRLAAPLASPALLATAAELLSTGDPAADPVPLAWTLHRDPTAAVNEDAIEFGATVLGDDLTRVLRALGERIARLANGVPEGEWRRAVEKARGRAVELEGDVDARLHGTVRRGLGVRADPPWGAAADFDRVSLADLRSFAAANLGPAQASVAVAGAADPAAVRAAVEAWPASSGPRVRARARAAELRGPAAWTESVIAIPEKPQNDLVVAFPGAAGRPWDAAATRLILYLLGETGYAGRLGTALVGPGLVYSVRATREGGQAARHLEIRTAASAADTPEVLARIRRILDDAARGAFTAEELAEAKAYLRGKRARSRDGSVATAGALVDEAWEPPPDADAVTLAQLNDTARRLFASGAPLAVIAGSGAPAR